MKNKLFSLIIGLALLAGVHQAAAQGPTASTDPGQLNAGSTATLNTAPATHTAAIPFDQIGAVAGKQYSGDGLAVASSPERARRVARFSG